MVTSIKDTLFPKPPQLILDVVHCIKLVRNCLGSYKVLQNDNGEAIEFSYFEKLHEIQKSEGLHLATKITSNHIDYKSQVMKTKFAVQLLSRSVSKALDYLRLDLKHQGFSGSAATSEFCLIFNNLFDVLNSRSIFSKYLKAPTQDKNKHVWQEVFSTASRYILGLKDANGTPIIQSRRKMGFLGKSLYMWKGLITDYKQKG